MGWEKLERVDAWKGRVAEDLHEEPKVHEGAPDPAVERGGKLERG